MSSWYELREQQELERQDRTRYACDYWCYECEDFIRNDEPYFYDYEGRTLCQKHYKRYLKRRGVK